MHRPHKQHAAATIFVHLVERSAGDQKSTVEVHIEHLAPIGIGQLVDRINVLDTGVGYGDVQTPPIVHNGLHALLNSLFVRDIHG